MCFLDLSKAFDNVWRNGLLCKLLNSGVGNRFDKIIKSMHHNVNCCISTNAGLTDCFQTAQGVRQGDSLSPQLFNLYLNDIPSILDNNDGIELGAKKICSLMYADDIALVSDSLAGLQRNLNKIGDYFQEWELKVNVLKSALMIFGSKASTNYEILYYGNTPLNTVTEYCHLGLNFTRSGTFQHAQRSLADKARKACFKLKQIISQTDLTPRKTLVLFHSLITPICTYASELWAPLSVNGDSYDRMFTDFENQFVAEKLYMSFCKFILGVNRKAVNLAVRGELGSYPLLLQGLKKVMKYYVRVKEIDGNGLLHHAYLFNERSHGTSKKTWINFFRNVEKLIAGEISDVMATQKLILGKYHSTFISKLQTAS